MKQNLKTFNLPYPLNTLRRVGVLLLMVVAICVSSCQNEEETQMAYNQCYDELFTLRMDINTLSKCLGVKSSDLIQMRYGLIAPNSEVTDVLSDLCKAFNDFNMEKVLDILNDDYDIEISDKKVGLSHEELIKQYRANVFARNEKFDGDIPVLISQKINHEVEKYMDTEFAWYRFPVNAWHYVLDGDKIATQYKAELNDILSTDKINNNVVTRFNDYSSLLEAEQVVLFGNELSLPDLKRVELEDASKIADSTVMNKFVERASTDLIDAILVLIEEVGVAIIIWFVFRWLTNRVINLYARYVLDYDFDNYGFWGNAAIFGLNLLNAWAENEEKRRLARIKTWVQSIVTVAFIIMTYIYVIKPQIDIEQNIMAQVESNVSAYVAKMDVPVLDYFNHVIDSIEL